MQILDRLRPSPSPRKRRLVRAAAAVVVGAGAAAMTVAPAFAGYAYSYLDNGRGYGHVDGTYVSACDTRGDNRGVVTQFYYGSGFYGDVADGNGSAKGCGTAGTYANVYKFRVCSRNAGSSSIAYCTSWKAV